MNDKVFMIQALTDEDEHSAGAIIPIIGIYTSIEKFKEHLTEFYGELQSFTTGNPGPDEIDYDYRVTAQTETGLSSYNVYEIELNKETLRTIYHVSSKIPSHLENHR